VRTALLLLLAERPMHGYEMISELEARSGGLWRPSPGSVYPTLQLLEDEGLVVATQDESRRRYELTEAGRELAGTLAEETPPWVRAEEESDDAILDLRRAMMTTVAAARQVAIAGDLEQRRAATAILEDARRRLYRLLGEETGGAEGEPA
jgi:DNA-binding PadR family transcriptional regulator